MKKVVGIFVLTLLMSASPIKENSLTLEDGKASDCVQQAKSVTFMVAETWGDDPNEDPFYMELYMELYRSCME
jgi:hypothetical protein